jgi:hypothetical protein
VAQNFANIPEGDTRKMVHDNVARVFGFPMNRGVPTESLIIEQRIFTRVSE